MAGLKVWRRLSHTAPLPDLILALNEWFVDVAQRFAAHPDAAAIPNGAVTPSIAGATIFTVNNTAATNITGLKDGFPGAERVLWSTTANTTLVHSATFYMKGAANIVMTAKETRRFGTIDGLTWREL